MRRFPPVFHRLLRLRLTQGESTHSTGEFDNAAAMMSVDETLLCSFQILKPAPKKQSPSSASLVFRAGETDGCRSSSIDRASSSVQEECALALARPE